MWIALKNFKVKTSIVDSKGKPIYDNREIGEPCPEASAWPKPDLWCRNVPDGSDEAKRALSAYKNRTGHELGSYTDPKKGQEDDEKIKNALKRLSELSNQGSSVSFSEKDPLPKLMKKIEEAERKMAPKAPAAKTPDESENESSQKNSTEGDATPPANSDDEEFDIDDD